MAEAAEADGSIVSFQTGMAAVLIEPPDDTFNKVVHLQALGGMTSMSFSHRPGVYMEIITNSTGHPGDNSAISMVLSIEQAADAMVELERAVKAALYLSGTSKM